LATLANTSLEEDVDTSDSVDVLDNKPLPVSFFGLDSLALAIPSNLL
jgi:hypothetical protein